MALPKYQPARLDTFDNTIDRSDWQTQDNVVVKFLLEYDKSKDNRALFGNIWTSIDPELTPIKGLTQTMKNVAKSYGMTKFTGDWKDMKKKHERMLSNHAFKNIKAQYQTDFWCDSLHSLLTETKYDGESMTITPLGFVSMWKNPETKLWTAFMTQMIEPRARHIIEGLKMFRDDRKDLSAKGKHCSTKMFRDVDPKTAKFNVQTYQAMLEDWGFE